MKFLISENDKLNSMVEEIKGNQFKEFESKVELLVIENEKLNTIIADSE